MVSNSAVPEKTVTSFDYSLLEKVALSVTLLFCYASLLGNAIKLDRRHL